MLTYFLEWYPKHNQDMQFQTLWLDKDNNAVAPHTPEAIPMVEQEFLFDLGYKVLIEVSTGKILKEWNPITDSLFCKETYTESGDCWALKPEEIVVGDESVSYYWEKYDTEDGNPLFGAHLAAKLYEVRVVPICYHGTMDKIVVDKYGRWWIVDYKTAKSADTDKLETDDQITTYLWAAEQKFNHKFHGFVYLQLTKDVAKPPRRLKDGTLSVDKKQKTTYALFKKEVMDDYGSVQKAPNKIIDMLNHLAEEEQPEGDRFIRWDFVLRNDHQKEQIYHNIMAQTKMMIDPDLSAFPNPTRDCKWDCPFRQICIAMDRGDEDVPSLIATSFKKRDDSLEHNDDDWKKNIKWPDQPMAEADINDETLKPANIFNIELPPEYYETRYDDTER
ncbi:MAG: PD-(D/E)XK nuclease family protein [Cellulosilyticaceae bacterium]